MKNNTNLNKKGALTSNNNQSSDYPFYLQCQFEKMHSHLSVALEHYLVSIENTNLQETVRKHLLILQQQLADNGKLGRLTCNEFMSQGIEKAIKTYLEQDINPFFDTLEEHADYSAEDKEFTEKIFSPLVNYLKACNKASFAEQPSNSNVSLEMKPWIEQRICHEKQEINSQFTLLLEKIKALFAKRYRRENRWDKENLHPSCFISYAWPLSPDDYQDETWTQGFVKQLALDLKAAGVNVRLDILEGFAGKELVSWMKKMVEQCDAIFVMGTQSLYGKHYNPTRYKSRVREELAHIRNRIDRDHEQQKQNTVSGVLVSGDETKSFQQELAAYKVTRSFQHAGYLKVLEQLLTQLFNAETDEQQKAFAEHWAPLKNVNNTLNICYQGLTTESIKNHYDELKKEKHDLLTLHSEKSIRLVNEIIAINSDIHNELEFNESPKKEENHQPIERLAQENPNVADIEKEISYIRTSLFRGHRNDKKAKKILAESIPTTMRLGSALATGDCFFDSIAQSLANLGKPNYTAKDLRLICHNYVVELDKGLKKDNWVYQRFLTNAKRLNPTGKDPANRAAEYYRDYMANIRYTAADIDAGEGLNINAAIWGEQDIDGRILCEQFGIKLHVIELLETEEGLILAHQLEGKSIDEADIAYDSPDTAHIAVFNNHFVPLLPNSFTDNSLPTYHPNNNEINHPTRSLTMLASNDIQQLQNIINSYQNSSAKQVFQNLAQKGYTWSRIKHLCLLDAERRQGRDLMLTLIEKREQLDEQYYEAAVKKLFPKGVYGIRDTSDGIIKDDASGFKFRYYKFLIFNKPVSKQVMNVQALPHAEILIKAPGSRDLTSDIDTTIEVKDINKIILDWVNWPQGWDNNNKDDEILVQAAVIYYFNYLNETELDISSGESRDSNVYSDGFINVRGYPNFSDEFSKYDLSFDSELKLNFDAFCLPYKACKQRQELAASLYSLREYFLLINKDRKWVTFKEDLLQEINEHCKDEDIRQVFIDSLEGTKAQQGVFALVEGYWCHKKQCLDTQRPKQSQNSHLSEQECNKDIEVKAMNSLYVKHLLDVATKRKDFIDKQATINATIDNLKIQLKNISVHKKLVNKYQNYFDKNDDEELAEELKNPLENSQKKLAALNEEANSTRNSLPQLFNDLAELINEQQDAQIKANLFANEAYINRSAPYHVVQWLQSQDSARIDKKQVVMGSILQQIGFRLLHAEQLKRAGRPLGEILYSVSKYGLRVADMLFGDKNSYFQDKLFTEQELRTVSPVLKRLGDNLTIPFKYSEYTLINNDTRLVKEIKKNDKIKLDKKASQTEWMLKEWIYRQKKPSQKDISEADINSVKVEEIDRRLGQDKKVWLTVAKKIIILTYTSKSEQNKHFWGGPSFNPK